MEVTLARGGKSVRLVDAGLRIAAQQFDGDPQAGARYLGTTGFPAKTLEEVTAHYERMGWTRTTTDNPDTKADS